MTTVRIDGTFTFRGYFDIEVDLDTAREMEYAARKGRLTGADVFAKLRPSALDRMDADCEVEIGRVSPRTGKVRWIT